MTNFFSIYFVDGSSDGPIYHSKSSPDTLLEVSTFWLKLDHFCLFSDGRADGPVYHGNTNADTLLEVSIDVVVYGFLCIIWN